MACLAKIGQLFRQTPVLWQPCVTVVRFRQRDRKVKDDYDWARPIIEKYFREKENGIAEREPSKLHMVYRTKPLKGRPYWEKETMKHLKLDGKINQLVVHKNTPQINSMLNSVQHLLKIIPLTFPYGLPENESDFDHCTVKDNGEFVLQKLLHPIDVVPTTCEPDEHRLKWKLDTDTIQKRLMRRLQTFEFTNEYFKPKYRYKFNQDGKEDRYFGDHNIGSDKEWF